MDAEGGGREGGGVSGGVVGGGGGFEGEDGVDAGGGGVADVGVGGVGCFEGEADEFAAAGWGMVSLGADRGWVVGTYGCWASKGARTLGRMTLWCRVRV